MMKKLSHYVFAMLNLLAEYHQKASDFLLPEFSSEKMQGNMNFIFEVRYICGLESELDLLARINSGEILLEEGRAHFLNHSLVEPDCDFRDKISRSLLFKESCLRGNLEGLRKALDI